MKQIIILGLFAASITACNKKKNWRYFNEDGMLFVSYEKGDRLKFLDTLNQVHESKQFSYTRDFRFITGSAIYGGVGPKQETYFAHYGWGSIGLTVNVKAPDSYDITMCEYRIRGDGKLPSPINSLTVNGKTYSNVYPFVAAKFVASNTPPAQAIVYWNKEYGAIQLLFPSGKAIMRVD